MSETATASKTPAAPPPVDMVNVQIDGEWHQFPKGTRMIEACRQVEKHVPHYCYHPKLTSPGNCRMCLVEMGMPPRPKPGEEPQRDENGRQPINWMPRPVIACANTVADNMGIKTQSVLTEECRKGVMEFLLINHPLDCPICDQAGECRLQEFSVEHGKGESRFRESKVKKPKNVDIGPRIRLDDERCIMCSRCIRFTDEIADDPVLGFTDRGSHTTLAVHPGKELANNYSLNTVDICPVGALTSNDFRFQMRVWFLTETDSICTKCGRGCNTTIGARGNEIFRQTPRQNNDVNSDWMCDQGRLDFHFVNSELRLTDPMIKEGGKHTTADWKVAIQKLATGLQKGDGSKVAIIASAGMTNEELFFVKQLAKTLGTENVDAIPRTGGGDDYLRADDQNPNTNGVRQIFGIDPGSKLDAIRSGVADRSIQSLLVLGEDLTQAGFDKADLEGLDFLGTLDILANPTADAASVVLPGSSFAEKRGTMINVTGRLQRLNRAIDSPGSARDTWEVLRDVVVACGGSNGLYMVEDVFKQLAGSVDCFKDLTFSKVGKQGVQVLVTEEKIPLLEREQERIAKKLIVG
jgi:NADH-quinone oxidoreductase subunit G